jgi:hypothetical protein
MSCLGPSTPTKLPGQQIVNSVAAMRRAVVERAADAAEDER